jgi:oligopeptide/dipeptide ABC transporter ATP-binding protein
VTGQPVLRVDALSVSYPMRRKGLKPAGRLQAVDEVSVEVERGGSLAIVGESGCGKSSLARAVVGLERSTGRIELDGTTLGSRRSRRDQRRVQMVFQDVASSLNPRRTVRQVLAELLRVHGIVPAAEVDARCEELVALVGLSSRHLDVRPHQLSGGQRQRVGIARALALEPDVLVADEPVSALDVSVQATILALLADLRDRLGLALVFISHDLGVVRHLCDDVAVMYLGRIVESGPTERLFAEARHPYTQALLRAAPSLVRARAPGAGALPGEPPSPTEVRPGCRFAPRCPVAEDRCRTERPHLTPTVPEVGDAHRVACHVRPLPEGFHPAGAETETEPVTLEVP